MTVILVLGKKLEASGDISREYKQQLAKAVELMRSGKAGKLVISGGVTTAGFDSEAMAGARRIPAKFQRRVLCENASKSTSENIQFVRELLAKTTVTSLVVITSKAHARRARLLIRRFWPEVARMTTYDSVNDTSARDIAVHSILYLLNILDPHDRIFLPILKKFSRNG